MLNPEPYNPLIYWPHVFLGIGSVLAVFIAIFAAKGSRLHRKAGTLFAVAMGTAAVTAILFNLWRFAPNALFSSVSVIYGVGMGVLALRARSGGWKALQWALAIIPVLLTLVGIVAVGSLFFQPAPIAMLIAAGVPATAVTAFFASLALRDFRLIRAPQTGRVPRYRHHALRMALAAAETVRAPLMSFGPPIGPEGALTFPIYFFGPFLLVALIYSLAMPDWVKRGEERPLPV